MAAILVLALVLRLINLNQSLWLDEAVSANVVQNYSLREIYKKFSPGDFHPPGYYWALKITTDGWGRSEVGLRLLSVLTGVGTVWMVYKMAGKGAAAATAVNPLLIYYSQEARQYSLATFLLMTWLFYFLRLEKKYSYRDLFWLNVLAGLSLTVFYGSIFLLAAGTAYWLIKKKYKLAWRGSWGWIMTLGMFKNLIFRQMQNSQLLLIEVKNWSLALGKLNLKNLILIPVKFSVGRVSFYPKKIYYLLAGGWTAIVGISFKKNKRLIFLIAGSLLTAIIFCLKSPMMQYFRFLYLVPMVMMLIKKKWLVWGFLGWSLIYLMIPKFHREDWRSLSQNLEKKVYMIISLSDPVKYYRPDIEVADLRGEISEEKIKVIPYAAQIHGLNYVEKLKKKGYELKEKQVFRGLETEDWQLTN